MPFHRLKMMRQRIVCLPKEMRTTGKTGSSCGLINNNNTATIHTVDHTFFDVLCVCLQYNTRENVIEHGDRQSDCPVLYKSSFFIQKQNDSRLLFSNTAFTSGCNK